MNRTWQVSTLICILFSKQLFAVEYSAMLDLRLVESDSDKGWLYLGLDKQRYDSEHDGIKLGQAVLEIRGQPWDTIIANATFNAYDERNGLFDVSEAYLQWKPLPTSSWRLSTKVGAFFPVHSFENNEKGWIAPDTLSTSAINTWIAEEFRTIGIETTLSRPGRFVQSPHDISISAAIFGWNDPAGSLLAWRGWSVHDRVTSLRERIPMSDLPVYQDDGPLSAQANWVEPFHEIDNRYGHYLTFNYSYHNQLQIRLMHYDNNGDPLALKEQQYAWDTRYQSTAVQWHINQKLKLIGQYMTGSSDMGSIYYGAFIDFESWYIMAKYHLAQHVISFRYDDFEVRDRDHLFTDNNSEQGDAQALSYHYQLSKHSSLIAEVLRVNSTRPARMLWPSWPIDISETTWQLAYRQQF